MAGGAFRHVADAGEPVILFGRGPGRCLCLAVRPAAPTERSETIIPLQPSLVLILAAVMLIAVAVVGWLRARAGQAAAEAALAAAAARTDRQDVERNALDQSNEFLTTLLENLQVGIVACDADGVLTLFNRATRNFHGLPQEPVPADRWAEHYQLFEADGCTPMTMDRVPLFRALRGERVEDATMVIAPGNAPPRTLLASGQAFHDSEGKLLGALVSMHDITERAQAQQALRDANLALEARVAKRTEELTTSNAALRAQAAERERAEAALAASEIRWQGIFEQLHEGFMLGEIIPGDDGEAVDARHLAVNAAWEAMTGIARDQAVGRSAYELIPGLESEWIKDFARVVEDGIPRTVTRRVGPLGRWLEANVFRPEPGRFAVLFVDASDRVEAQQHLLDSEARLRFVMDAMPQKVFTSMPDGAVDYFNPQWSEFTGLSFEQIREWGWTQFIHPDDLSGNLETWKHSIETGLPFHFEHRFRSADGHYRWQLTRALPQRDGAGSIIKWVGSSSDVHDHLEAAEQLRRTSAELAESDRRKSEFLAMLAHELRNPLAPLSYALDMLTKPRGEGANIDEVVGVMRRQVAQLVRLVDDLLDISRINRGKVELRTEMVDLDALLQRAVEMSRPALEAAGHELVLDLPVTRTRFKGDPVRLVQVFSNLLNNAAKYTPPGGRISLSATVDDEHVRVAVDDTGMGIAEEQLDAIFDIFVQLDRSPERSTGGLGIGLTLVRRLVELHGGHVSASSAGPGQGSRFGVTLPRSSGN